MTNEQKRIIQRAVQRYAQAQQRADELKQHVADLMLVAGVTEAPGVTLAPAPGEDGPAAEEDVESEQDEVV